MIDLRISRCSSPIIYARVDPGGVQVGGRRRDPDRRGGRVRDRVSARTSPVHTHSAREVHAHPHPDTHPHTHSRSRARRSPLTKFTRKPTKVQVPASLLSREPHRPHPPGQLPLSLPPLNSLSPPPSRQADDESLLPKEAKLSDGATKGGGSGAKYVLYAFAYLLLAAAVVFAYVISKSQGLTVQDLYAAAKQWIDGLVAAEIEDAETSPICDDGLVIPGPHMTRGNTALFVFLLLWSFLGVAIAADVFMIAIEVITSTELTKVVEVNGVKRTFTVSVWNATVANLTLMALGSSAPEIMLSLIEIGSSGFYSGELGPSTIVGSAAFNLLVIIAVCIVAIPAGETRKIDDLGVFYITASFSVFAYVWLIVILQFISPNIVEVWEGALTFAFFPMLVYLAYLADSGAFTFKADGCCRVLCCRRRRKDSVVELRDGSHVVGIEAESGGVSKEVNQLLAASADPRLTKEAREKAMNDAQLALKKAKSDASAQPKSRAFYRVSATRSGTGGASPKVDEKAQLPATGEAALTPTVFSKFFSSSSKAVVQFSAAGITVGEDIGTAHVGVVRRGVLMSTVTVKYSSQSGTATAGLDFIAVSGELTFFPGQTSATIKVPILDDDIQEGKETFAISLVAPETGNVVIGETKECEVTIEDNDEYGQFFFQNEYVSCKESQRKVILTVVRRNGNSGTATCDYKTKEGSATEFNDKTQAGDYVAVSGTLTFPQGVSRKDIAIDIIDDGNFERDEMFQVVLSNPTGGATFEDNKVTAVCSIKIVSDEERKDLLNLMASELNLNMDSIKLSGTSWAEQITDSVKFEGGSCIALLFYLLSLPFKIIFAFVPPPRLAGGWACFLVALCLIGVLTAIIGDLAAHTGCCLGLLPSVTAITFVALGTSLPDTFASKAAATSEPNADNSIGNVTGSNSVNVFLGLGMPWAAAAVYWAYQGQANEAEWRARYRAEPWYSESMPVGFAVPAGDLGFSVGVFTVCALTCLGCVILRRALIGCELGGPTWSRYASALFFVLLWFVYIGCSAASSYGLLDDIIAAAQQRVAALF